MRIRKPWAVLLGLQVVAFIAGVYPYLTLGGRIHPFQVLQIGIDLIILWGLFGYVTRRPVKSFALRLLYFTLVAIILCRVILVIYLVAPGLSPWLGLREQYVSLVLLLSIPLALLTAFALWRYASESQRALRGAGPASPAVS